MAPPPRFPLPDAQLPTIRVSAAQHEELRAFLLPMAREVVRDGPSWGRTNMANARAAGWKVSAATDDSCFLTRSSSKRYRGFGADAAAKRAEGGDTDAVLQPPPTTGQCFMGYSVSPYSLEDIMSSVYCETTEELRAHFNNTYGSACLDCCVLATLEGATLEDPFWYVGIKWLALKSPVKKLVSSREFVFLELSGSHVAHDGRRMLYRILQSVDIRGYGGKSSYFGLTRGHIEAAFVYWADDARSTPDRPVLNVCTKGRAHLKGNLPLWLVQLYLKRFWNSKRSVRIAAVLQSAQSASSDSNEDAAGGDDDAEDVRSVARKASKKDMRRQISDDVSSSSGSMPLDMATTWVPNESRAACYVCQKKFQLVRRPKHHCRSCGEVICSDCTSYSKLNVPPMLAHSRSAMSEPMIGRSESATNQQRRSSRKLARAHEPYVTVGKVCHRCMDLKSIMHNNSTRLSLVDAHTTVSDGTAASEKRESSRKKDHYESHSMFPPSRDTGDRDRRSVGSGTHGGEVITTRIGRESSLSSSEVRAIIESNRANSTAEAASGGITLTASANFKMLLDTIASDCIAYDDEVDDDDDDDSNVDLEFHPVLANDVPTHELIEDTNGLKMTDSVSLFNPDSLFQPEEEQIGSSDDEAENHGDDDATGGVTNDNIVARPSKESNIAVDDQLRQQREPQDPLSSLSTSTRSTGTGVASPTRSSSLLQSTSSWSRRNEMDENATSTTATTTTGEHVSLEDVKLAIADHVKLLEVIKRERQDHDAP